MYPRNILWFRYIIVSTLYKSDKRNDNNAPKDNHHDSDGSS